MANEAVYQDPLVSRYTSKFMQSLFSEENKFRTWRQCWIALAEAEHELGIKDDKGNPRITAEQVAHLREFADNINYDVARAKEREIRQDVMAHVYAYGQQVPDAEAILHLGATSCEVTCNAELLQQHKGLVYVESGVVTAIDNLARFAGQHKGLVTLAYTHYQPAQPTTVGKRTTLYIQDLLMDLDAIEFVLSGFKTRGIKGTTGTQASYLELFEGDHKKVEALDELFSKKMGFDVVFPVTGQTYPRKFDTKIAEAVAGIGVSANKFAVDLRLLANLKVQEEPFEKDQTGSSAMPYKRNPMRAERMTSLSRKLMGLPRNFYDTAANQWLERSLDDSAIRRMDIAQEFLLADAILRLYNNIVGNMVVYEKVIERRLREELPFMATETILMQSVRRGASRQQIHESIKKHAKTAGDIVKLEGKENDLFSRITSDEEIPFEQGELDELLKEPRRFAGRAPEQTERFLTDIVEPALDKHKKKLGKFEYTVSV